MEQKQKQDENKGRLYIPCGHRNMSPGRDLETIYNEVIGL